MQPSMSAPERVSRVEVLGLRHNQAARVTRHARLHSPPDPRIVLRVCTTYSSPRRLGPDYVLDYVMDSLDVTSNVVQTRLDYA
jgi:hypothetical protein